MHVCLDLCCLATQTEVINHLKNIACVHPKGHARCVRDFKSSMQIFCATEKASVFIG